MTHRARGPRPADAGPAQRAQRHGGDRRRARARHRRRGDPQGARGLRRRQAPLHPHRRVERRRRSSTITATTRSRSPRCCKAARAVDRRARSSPSSSRTATRGFVDLFDEFCACFNDADTVIVAAGLCRRRGSRSTGADRDASSRARRRAATATPCRSTRPEDLAGARRAASPSPATTSSASAPATSRNGPTRLPGELAGMEKAA